ncbi:hypothetical protein GCM10009715_17080 [Paeniglutamicibacter psychrophenolicus]|uniref:Uncharacterized protein n=1 Tax=Paeniglutamicibacter psychrophenolicus TaxID=257454 RepID=A0ABS4WCN3_9MICC|nr:hypothetical protein [Paeniglutamicibacter psychrophenolicus]MBP2373952.1 hypothetical protein [Paeniglutamicibacter psychrophenolicus]
MFKYYDPELVERDKAVVLAHEPAVARGEKRLLVRTTDGELFSYLAEEIGFTTGGAGAKITTGPGMFVGAGFLWAMVLSLGIFMVSGPVFTAGEMAGLPFVELFAAVIAWYFTRLGMAEHRARKLRKARKLPKPLLAAPLDLP